MSGFEVVRAADHRVMPWKNGGGSTAEIAIFPAGVSMDDFEWRLSMAHVGESGPFSSFPGVDRTLAVLEGEGLDLSVGGGDPVALIKASAPFRFRADLMTSCALRDGPVDDLNVMTRRATLGHAMRRLMFDGAATIDLAGRWGVVFCVRGDVRIAMESEALRLGRHDALVVANGIRLRAQADGRAELFLIKIFPASEGK